MTFSPADYSSLLYSAYIPPGMMSQDQFDANAKTAAKKYLAYIEKAASSAGVHYEGYSTPSAAPWEAIIAGAKKKRCV